MKLVSMVDYVEIIHNKEVTVSYGYRQKLQQITNYANFLKQPLKLEMFVPCDDESTPIEPPTEKDKIDLGGGFATIKERQELEDWENDYQKAQEKVLFKGFEFLKKPGRHSGLHTYVFKHQTKGKVLVSFFLNSNIEDVVYLDLELTENAIKKLNK